MDEKHKAIVEEMKAELSNKGKEIDESVRKSIDDLNTDYKMRTVSLNENCSKLFSDLSTDYKKIQSSAESLFNDLKQGNDSFIQSAKESLSHNSESVSKEIIRLGEKEESFIKEIEIRLGKKETDIDDSVKNRLADIERASSKSLTDLRGNFDSLSEGYSKAFGGLKDATEKLIISTKSDTEKMLSSSSELLSKSIESLKTDQDKAFNSMSESIEKRLYEQEQLINIRTKRGFLDSTFCRVFFPILSIAALAGVLVMYYL